MVKLQSLAHSTASGDASQAVEARQVLLNLNEIRDTRVTAGEQLTLPVGPVDFGCGLYMPPHLPHTDRRSRAETILAHRGVACCRLHGTWRGPEARCNRLWEVATPVFEVEEAAC